MTDLLLEVIAPALADRFTIERLIGRGGMGAVYLAADLAHERPVALKVLDPALGAAIGGDRFAREVRLTARLQHPHICALYESGEIAVPHGSPHLWFTMPFVAGGSLAERIRAGPLAITDAVRIAREAAAGLAFAHRHGVLHRDVKPGNILLSEDGHAQVADFGIARVLALQEDSVELERLTQTGLSLGTPAYMSPEQAMGDKAVDARADVYAMGAVLYEMLVGEPPYTGPTAQAIIARQLTGAPRSLAAIRPEVPAALEDAVFSALERSPADRTPSMEAFGRGLDEHVSPTAVPGEPRKGSIAPGRRLSRRVLLGSAAGLLVVGATLVALARAVRRGAATGIGSAGPSSIAVLPFDNQGLAADDYFADGMTDAIRGALAQLPDLRVIGRNTSRAYKGTRQTPQQIARELGARYLVTGTVRWAHRPGGTEEVEVRPELEEVVSPDSSPIARWDRAIVAPLTDVFKVQGEIASQVASALNLVLGRSTEARLAQPLTHSMQAYLVYLKGEAATARSFDPAAQEEAAADYRQAIALDSGFVQAWARLARSYAITYYTGSQDPAVGDSSRWAAERASALGPDNAAAAEALARYYGLVKQDPDRALVEITRARKLAPSDGDITMFMGLMEQFRGDVLVGVRDLEAAHRLDPRSSRTTYNLGSLYLTLRRYADAEALITTARAAFPDAPEFWQLAVQLPLQQGNLDSVHALLVHNRLTDRELARVTIGTYGWLIALAFDDASRQRMLTMSPEAFNGDTALLRLAQSMIYTAQGDRARATGAAEEAVKHLEPVARLAAPDPTRLLMLGEALAYAGRRAEALALAARVLALPPLVRNAFTRDVVQQGVALIYTEANEQDKAIDLLATLLRRDDYPLTTAWLRVDPTLEPLRSNARFQRLIAQP